MRAIRLVGICLVLVSFTGYCMGAVSPAFVAGLGGRLPAQPIGQPFFPQEPASPPADPLVPRLFPPAPRPEPPEAEDAGLERMLVVTGPSAESVPRAETPRTLRQAEEFDAGAGETFRSVRTLDDIAGAFGFRVTVSNKLSPLVLDLDGNGIHTRSPASFDLDGDGALDLFPDVSAGDGVLVFDADGDGESGENGLELLGDGTDLDGDGRKDGYEDGFKALEALARKAVSQGVLSDESLADGRLDAGDLEALHVRYGLGIKTGGLSSRALAPAAAGAASIVLAVRAAKEFRDFDGQGTDMTWSTDAKFTRADGSVGLYADLWFSLKRP